MKQSKLNFNKRPLSHDDSIEARSLRHQFRKPTSSILPLESADQDQAEKNERIGGGFTGGGTTSLSIRSSPSSKNGFSNTSRKVFPGLTQRVPPPVDLPTSSQPASFLGSQRIVKNGERMVTNSDDDGDESSLEDLDELLRNGKAGRPAESTSSKERLSLPTQKAQPTSNLRSRPNDTNHFGKKVHEPPSPYRKPEFKYSLGFLAEQSAKHKQSDIGVAKVNAFLASNNEERRNFENPDRPPEKILDLVMQEGQKSEEVERLKIALRSTEALHRKKTWQFFRAGDLQESAPRPHFPKIRDTRLRKMLGGSRPRERAFLCGWLSELARVNPLPQEVLVWTFKMLPFEARDDLRTSYSEALISSRSQLHALITVDLLRRSFQNLGASQSALETGNELNPKMTASDDRDPRDRSKLVSFLEFLQAATEHLHRDVMKEALILISRLLLDQSIIADCQVTISIHGALSSLIKSIISLFGHSELQLIVESITASVQDPSLRYELLNHLPAFDSPTAVFRRSLAAAFLLGSREISQAQSQLNMHTIVRRLQDKEFHVDHTTDYNKLICSITILNICTDSGDSPTSFPTWEDEVVFNKMIDQISVRLRELSSQIIDTGALNMGRTEAKQAIDNFLRRLNYTIRTEPPPKRTILGDEIDPYVSEKMGMNNWIKKHEMGSTAA